jgi:hypothetical protein
VRTTRLLEPVMNVDRCLVRRTREEMLLSQKGTPPDTITFRGQEITCLLEKRSAATQITAIDQDIDIR